MTGLHTSRVAAQARSDLLKAGMKLLGERPVDAVSIAEIEEAASVKTGAFYDYFDDKERFIREVTELIRIRVERWIVAMNHGVDDPVERLAGAMITAAAYAFASTYRRPLLSRALHPTKMLNDPINFSVVYDLNDACQRGLVKFPSVDAGVLFWVGTCQTLAGSILSSEIDEDGAIAFLTHVLTMALRGLAVAEATIERITSPVNVLTKFRSLEY